METIKEIVRVKQIVMEREGVYATAITGTDMAGELAIQEIGDEAQEVLLLLVLNTKNEINAMHRVFVGSINSSVANPREIFRTALMNNGTRIMLFHNHPSGNPEPSQADLDFTSKISKLGKMMGIELLDHIIVTNKRFISLRAEGALR